MPGVRTGEYSTVRNNPGQQLIRNTGTQVPEHRETKRQPVTAQGGFKYRSQRCHWRQARTRGP
ncbi:unnamed protein product [Staurois parvus]|uniref:Uncharacterized protein n=1 Tax=Staurois parvus TaxID=386267 RepID=A0ABN9G1M4_9NEOB|nr:unnamed protein product [Staurois parvus]